MKKSFFVLIVMSFFLLSFSGCQSDSTTQNGVYQKRNQTLSLENEPSSYREYALVSSGDIEVKKTLVTQGPLADVHSNGEIKARALSLDISGKITSSNNLDFSLVRSFNYETANTKSFVQIRALKVSEYLNTNDLYEYYLLTSDGKALHKVQDKDDETFSIDAKITFKNNKWIIEGDSVTFAHPLVVQGDLQLQTNYTFIAGTLMVQGNLYATGELNINTGTPFQKALIVDNNIELDKFVAIGRVHGSGNFIAHSEVNILGNAEIDGDVELWGDAKINFLDNVYKSALYEAQEEASESNTTMMLVHSQLFSDVKGNNSVVLFTFVEGNYILNENTLYKLFDANKTDNFQFKSYLYGATIDYGAQLQKFEGLSPYYYNKYRLLHKLEQEGYKDVKISESLDIAPSNLYHTFTDSNGDVIATYQLYSLANKFNEENLTVLTQEERDEALYALEHKEEIEIQKELEAKQKQEEQKQAIIDNEDLNLSVKSEMLQEIEAFENNETIIDKEAIKEETTQQRVQEWVQYKELAVSNKEIEAKKVDIDTSKTRGCCSSIVKVVKKVFKKVASAGCKKKTERKYIWGVKNAETFKANDKWGKYIQLQNNAWSACTPVSASMVLNYHQLHKKKKNLYTTDGHWNSFSIKNWKSLNNKKVLKKAQDKIDYKVYASVVNPYVLKMANLFGTSKEYGTSFFSLYFNVPRKITKELRYNNINGYAWSHYVAFWNIVKHHNRIKWYLTHDNPVIFSAWQSYGKLKQLDNRYHSTKNHSMVAIGYKKEYYKGICLNQLLPEKKWLLVDSTWFSRGYLRFDARSNYWKFGTVTYVRVY